MFRCQIGVAVFAVLIGLFFTGCIGPDKNKAPTVAQISCPETARVGDEISISVVATDPNGDRIAYKVAFGDGVQSEWSSLLVSGETKTFLYTYNEPGDYGIKAIASDEHHKNSGWSEETYIKVIVEESQIGPERIMWCVSPDADFQKIKDLGITVVQYYSIYWESDYGLAYLNKAERHGLKVLYYMGAMVQDLIRQGKSWSREDCKRLIESFDSHPALWGWQPYDEADAGIDNPTFLIPMETQRDVYHSLKQWGMKKLFVHALRGGTKGWHLIDLTLGDVIMPDLYVYDGTGECWGLEPLVALEVALKQEREYLDSNNIQKPIIFTFQCCMVPAEGIDPHQPLPEGIIEDQFNLIKKYDLFTGGLSFWAWNGGYYSPATSPEAYGEIKVLLEKIRERAK